MGVRISTNLDLIAGLNNDLVNKVFGGNGVISAIIDTLEHATTATYQIQGGATEQIDFGDIADLRYLYLSGDSEFSLALAAALATAGTLPGVAGTYPSGFAGGEVLELIVDTIPITVTFDAADQTRDQVVARINFDAANTNAAFVAKPIAFPNVADLLLRSLSTGPSSTMEVLASSTPAVLTALGLTATTNAGTAAEPGTTDIRVLRPADPAGSSAAEGLQAYFLGTVQASALQVTNLSLTSALNLTTFLAGDLVATP